MSLWKKILQVHPDTEEWKETLTPENTLEKLKEYNSNDIVIAKSKKLPPQEWLLNSFQYASYKILPDDVVRMADYLNSSEVFKRVAPAFYGNTTWNHVVYNMFDRCSAEKRVDLLSTLESNRGHMQKIVKSVGLGGAAATSLYYNIITESLNVQDSIRLLKNSPSFQIVKNNPNFSSSTIGYHPDYKPLLD